MNRKKKSSSQGGFSRNVVKKKNLKVTRFCIFITSILEMYLLSSISVARFVLKIGQSEFS